MALLCSGGGGGAISPAVYNCAMGELCIYWMMNCVFPQFKLQCDMMKYY